MPKNRYSGIRLRTGRGCGIVENMHNEKLLRTAEVAAELGVHRSTVTRMVDAGKVKPAIRGEGIRGSMFFYLSEVQRAKKRLAEKSDA